MGGVRTVIETPPTPLRRPSFPGRRRGAAHVSRRSAIVGLMVASWVVSCGEGSAGQDGARRDPELERKVEELLPQVEELSYLTAARVPEVRVADAATLEAYLLQRIEAEYPEGRLESLARAYQKFGLLPDDVDLRQLLVDLVLEQTLGYYDPARDILFIREEVPDEALEQVMVHELVHALQDQHIDLDSLLRGREENDARAAAQAAMEGHATLVMLVYQLSQLTGSRVPFEQLPEIGPELAAQAGDAPEMQELFAAPAIVRETMLFPYFGGASYLQRLWRSQGAQFAPLGKWLPESTEQVLHVDRLLEGDRPSTLEIGPAAGWNVEYEGDLGELEIRIYFEEHLGEKGGGTAARAAAGWDGDRYVLLEKDGSWALVWYTTWDSDSDAEEFVDAYRRAFQARFGLPAGELASVDRTASVEKLTLSGAPTVRVVETPAGVALDDVPGATVVVKGGAGGGN